MKKETDYWFDYMRQAWVVAGRYIRCGHPDALGCRCYGREHAGGPATLNGPGQGPDLDGPRPRPRRAQPARLGVHQQLA